MLRRRDPVQDGAAPAALLEAPIRPTAADVAFGQRLATNGAVGRTQLNEAWLQLPESGRSIGRLLVELGAMDERLLASELSEHTSIPMVDLKTVDPEAGALQLVPETVARDHLVLPLRLVGTRLEVAVADPTDEVALYTAMAYSQRELLLRVAPASAIQREIASSYRSLIDVGGIVQAYEAIASLRKAAAEIAALDADDDAPVVQLVTQLLTRALHDRASDVHIEPQNERVRVRFRIDGALHDVLAMPGKIGPAVVSRLKIMADMNIADKRRAQDGQIALTIDDRNIDVRVNTVPTVWGEKAVLRILDRTRVVYRLDELGMRPGTHEQFIRLVRSPFGMVVCAGPTGSGKTTTLYATLAEVNQTERNVTTIEDPVEYVFPSLTQIQINPAAGLTFATGLKAILRQDPDVILVGEIRDVDTARIAIESALTGHLVLSSIHATDACSALQRLIDMGIESFLVASTVTGMASQRLFRKICDHCKVDYDARPEDVAFYDENGGASAEPLTRLWRAEGCEHCSNTGYRDRVGVFELVRMTDSIKKLILANASIDELRAAAQADGSQSLVQEALRLVREGVTTLDEFMRNVYGGCPPRPSRAGRAPADGAVRVRRGRHRPPQNHAGQGRGRARRHQLHPSPAAAADG